MLLWHGSRLSNWVGILSQGLCIAPPEAPVTGYMVRSRQCVDSFRYSYLLVMVGLQRIMVDLLRGVVDLLRGVTCCWLWLH